MKKRVLLALLMAMLLAVRAACAQTLPSNAVFSPGLIRLAEILGTEVEYLATGVHPEPGSVVLNIVETVERVEEKVVVKEVIRHVRRKPVKKNPIDYWIVGGAGFLLGLLIGLIF